MKTIIAGSRDINDQSLVDKACLECGWEITEVVSGCAPGVDLLGQIWASRRNIPIRQFPAHWEAHGKAAGPIRNEQMAVYANALIAITNGSSGTRNMIAVALKAGIKTHVVKINHPPKED